MPKAQEGENEKILPPKGGLGNSSLFNVKDKKVLITGGGSGIGAMIAATFVENGADVTICSRKDTSAYAGYLTQRGPGKCEAIADIDVLCIQILTQLCQKYTSSVRMTFLCVVYYR